MFCSIFSGAQQQQSAFKPTGFGATAQPAATGGLFGSSTPAFGAATAPAAGAFGQPQQQAAGAFGQPQQQAGSIGLFGANNQAKPLGKKPPFISLLHDLPTVQTVNEVLIIFFQTIISHFIDGPNLRFLVFTIYWKK